MSRKRNDGFSEAIVGLFMIAVLALLVYFTIVISGVDVLQGREKVTVDVLNHGGEKFLTADDHYENWLEAIAREDPTYTVTDAEGGHRSTAFCSLGRMCMELSRGKKDGAALAWNAAKEVSGSPEADAMLKPFARGKYDLRFSLASAGLDYNKMIKPL